MSAEVVIELSGEEVARVPLSAASMVIGRDPSADIHLDNLALSRRHAQLEQRGPDVWIRDLGSQNGTYVNGERVDGERALQNGDSVELGRYTISIAGPEQSPVASPVVTINGPTGEQRFAMVGDEIIIGRSPSCDIPIRHKSISRQHLRITMEGALFIAEDLGSQNGTRLRGQLINGPTPFEPGEALQLSDFIVDVEFEDAPNGVDSDGINSTTMMIERSELAKGAPANGSSAPAALPHPQPSARRHDSDDDLGQRTAQVTRGEDGSLTGGRLPSQEGHLERRANGRPSDEPGHSAMNGRHPVTGRHPITSRAPRAPQQSARPEVSAAPSPPTVMLVHPDFEETSFELRDEINVFGEDGQQRDGSAGRAFADQGYLLLIRTSDGLVATVAGDRRLLTVNGRPQLCSEVDEGDTIELGLLAVIVQSL